MAFNLSADDIAILRKLEEDSYLHATSAYITAGPQRDRLRKAGMIESWRPLYKNIGKRSPFRLTEAGRAALIIAEIERLDRMEVGYVPA